MCSKTVVASEYRSDFVLSQKLRRQDFDVAPSIPHSGTAEAYHPLARRLESAFCGGALDPSQNCWKCLGYALRSARDGGGLRAFIAGLGPPSTC